MIFLIKLILAHVIGDFILQPKSWVENKQEKTYCSPYLYLHSAMHAVLAWLIVMEWNNWKLPIAIFFFHLVIDYSKSIARRSIPIENSKREKKKMIWDIPNVELFLFIFDQIFHLISIFIIWIFLKDSFQIIIHSMSCIISTHDNWIIGLAYLVLLFPISIAIALATSKWQKQIEEDDGLNQAGKYIGMLERFLVLTFLLLNQYAAIGFLLAAKSVFRFGELQKPGDRKKTEYILIGTLLSFSIAIIIGLVTLSLLE